MRSVMLKMLGICDQPAGNVRVCGKFDAPILLDAVKPPDGGDGRPFGSAIVIAENSPMNPRIPGTVVDCAMTIDPNLINPWGIAHSATSPFWVSDNGEGVTRNEAGRPGWSAKGRLLVLNLVMNAVIFGLMANVAEILAIDEGHV
jgi:hypothetical protein